MTSFLFQVSNVKLYKWVEEAWNSFLIFNLIQLNVLKNLKVKFERHVIERQQQQKKKKA